MILDSSNEAFLSRLPTYPLTALRDEFLHALGCGLLLLEAEPGAGKSTLAPLWALSANPSARVILVQPRVLAAQALAQRLADLVDDDLGCTVGYQIPFDQKISAQTRLLVTTPGILLQQLLQDPTLAGVGCVMLDEIHERAVNQDTAWAWLQEVQILRDDLQLVLMSATPDPQLQQSIPQRLFAPGRCFPVTTQYLPAKAPSPYPETIEQHVLRALAQADHWQGQTLLVFLAGWSEIEACAKAIQAKHPQQAIYRLHSRVAAAEQRRALNPSSGPRIILATNIAETSLTIADVTWVIDSGWVRRPDYEQRTGLTRLRLARISQASADQRRGRAGRVQAGHCIRLWSQDQPLAAAALPEIRATDYLPLVLRLAHWGSPPMSLPWLEAPNALAITFAQRQLQQMQLLDAQQKITPKGEFVSRLGTHPRVAAFLLGHQDTIATASLLLALAMHFDGVNEGDISDVLQSAERELAQNKQWQQQQKRWLQALQLRTSDDATIDAILLAQAFSDRMGYRQESGRYRLNSGISVDAPASLDSPWAVFPIINPKPKGHGGVGIAVQLSTAQQRELSEPQVQLLHKQGKWQQQTQWRMGGVVIDTQLSAVPASDLPTLLVQEIHARIAQQGLLAMHWSEHALSLLQRARSLQAQSLLELPALSDDALTQTLAHWLAPFLNDKTQVDKLPWGAALEYLLGYDNCRAIAQLFPETLPLPSGRHVRIEFSAEGIPQISAKLQEFFGCEQLQLAGGRLPLKIHLLAPNGSPAAITMNLHTFWQQAYGDVRKQLRGKYPRHPWPENPLEHEATALTKRKLAMQQTNE